MTERRAFEARVRARMAETGQSYAQAAAILETGNPAHTVDTHPASALVVSLLRTEGIELAPELAFGIGGGIGFMYAVRIRPCLCGCGGSDPSAGADGRYIPLLRSLSQPGQPRSSPHECSR
jgi:hypothetical protein